MKMIYESRTLYREYQQKLHSAGPSEEINDVAPGDMRVISKDAGGGNYMVISCNNIAFDNENEIDNFAKLLKENLRDIWRLTSEFY